MRSGRQTMRESNTRPTMLRRCGERWASWSAIAAPIDHPNSTTCRAPCRIAYSIAAAASAASVKPTLADTGAFAVGSVGEIAAPRMADTSGDRFCITLGTREYDSRSETAHALAVWMGDSGLKWLPRYGHRDFGVIGRISGFDIHVEARSGLAALDVTVSLPEVPRSGFTMSKESFLDAELGLVQRIENRVSGIPALLDQAHADLEEAEQTIADTQQRLGQPFRHTQALADAEEDLARVEAQLAAMKDEPAPEPAAPTSERLQLTIEAVRAGEPNLGSREGAAIAAAGDWNSTAPHSPEREPPQLRL